MSLRVLTAATTRKLIAHATLVNRLGISNDNTRLSELNLEASSAIEEYVGRILARQRYTETLTGNWRSRLALSCLPLDRDSVTLTIDGTAYTDFSVESWESGHLWRDGGWPANGVAQSLAERDEENIAVTYKAGYVLPDMIGAWVNSATVVAGTWIRPTTPVGDLLMECTTAGAVAASEPTWPTTAGSTVTSSAAVYTARHAVELPKQIVSAAWLTVHQLHTSMTRGFDVRAIEGDGQRIEYATSNAQTGPLPLAAMRMLDAWRFGA